MNSSFMQYGDTLEKYVKKAQKVNSFCPERLVMCLFHINFLIFEVKAVPVSVYNNIQLACIILDIYTYLSPTNIFCPF